MTASDEKVMSKKSHEQLQQATISAAYKLAQHFIDASENVVDCGEGPELDGSTAEASLSSSDEDQSVSSTVGTTMHYEALDYRSTAGGHGANRGAHRGRPFASRQRCTTRLWITEACRNYVKSDAVTS